MMRRIFFQMVFLFIFAANAFAISFDEIMKGLGSTTEGGADDATTVSGLKEALSIGTENAVKNVSQVDGYFSNQMIKILMPEKIQKVADVLKMAGYQKEVDDFILSMNRAAEKAAPQATSYFIDAIKGMTFEDATNSQRRRYGGDTILEQTQDKLYTSFKPVISSSMNEVGVTRSYKEMMGQYESLPFEQGIAGPWSLWPTRASTVSST
jgi:hypothetical protein